MAPSVTSQEKPGKLKSGYVAEQSQNVSCTLEEDMKKKKAKSAGDILYFVPGTSLLLGTIFDRVAQSASGL
jgi:hypothetical protein